MDNRDPLEKLDELKQEYRQTISFELESYNNKKGPKSMEEFKRRVFGYFSSRTDIEFSPNLIDAIIKEVIWDEGYYGDVIDWRLQE